MDARSIEEFRTISLGNFSEKIISPILATGMVNLLPQIVDEEYAGFIKGGNIVTHITMGQEIIRDINRKVSGGNVNRHCQSV